MTLSKIQLVLTFISASTIVFAIWVIPMMAEKAFANWGNWYQCGSGQFQSGGSTYAYQWTCRNYYQTGTSGFVVEQIGHYCEWKYLGYGGWQFIGCSTDQVLYYCNPFAAGNTCGSA